MKGNYEDLISLSYCYSCGVCAAVCPVDIITMTDTDGDGFLRPDVKDKNRCIECGKCSLCCSFINPTVRENKGSSGFAAWTNDDKTRSISSSGGIGYELTRRITSCGGRACGVRYDTAAARAEHYLATDDGSIGALAGSKYLLSHSSEALRQLLREDTGRDLLIAAPCQIASMDNHLRSINKRDRFLLVDFFCHGVPSYLLWQRYLQDSGLDHANIDRITFRDKSSGWQNSYCITAFSRDRVVYSSPARKGDLFFRFYLRNYILNTCCYKCPFRGTVSAADIRMGDLWGDRFRSDKKGVSALLTFTARGRDVINSMGNIRMFPVAVNEILQGQLKGDIPVPEFRDNVINGMRRGERLSNIYKRQVILGRIKRLPKRIAGLLKR